MPPKKANNYKHYKCVGWEGASSRKWYRQQLVDFLGEGEGISHYE